MVDYRVVASDARERGAIGVFYRVEALIHGASSVEQAEREFHARFETRGGTTMIYPVPEQHEVDRTRDDNEPDHQTG